jgi:hypothetical protein
MSSDSFFKINIFSLKIDSIIISNELLKSFVKLNFRALLYTLIAMYLKLLYSDANFSLYVGFYFLTCTNPSCRDLITKQRHERKAYEIQKYGHVSNKQVCTRCPRSTDASRAPRPHDAARGRDTTVRLTRILSTEELGCESCDVCCGCTANFHT